MLEVVKEKGGYQIEFVGNLKESLTVVTLDDEKKCEEAIRNMLAS